MYQLSQSIRSLHDSFVAYGNNLIDNTTTHIKHHASISNLNKEIRRLEPSPTFDALSSVQKKKAERKSLEATMRSAQDAAAKSREGLMNAFFNELKTICKQRENAGKANASNKLLLQMLQLQKTSKDAVKSFRELKEDYELQIIALQFHEGKAATMLKEARDSAHEKQVQQKSEHKEALRIQAERFQTQIDDANAKNRLHKATLIKLEEAEMKVRTVENEKAQLALAKAAVENELHDLRNQADQWKSFADGYRQIKEERDLLLGQLNDAVAERDELSKNNRADDASEAHAASKIPLNAPTHSVENIRVDDRHLKGVEIYWQKQLDLAEIMGRNTEAELAEVEEEISEIENILAEEQTKKEAASGPSAIGSTDNSSEQDSFLPIDDAAEPNMPSEADVADDVISMSGYPGDINATSTADPNQTTAPITSGQDPNSRQIDVSREPLGKISNATNSRQQHSRVVSHAAPLGNPMESQRPASAIAPHQAWPTLRQAHGQPPGAAQNLLGSRAQPDRRTSVQSVKVVQNPVGRDESWSAVGPKGKAGRKGKK
ncbi:hypothetical protein FB567DRAFT_530205 [Paraphoma chrysanthemicola]|uniref:Uncharacterized protein n=1 Tax=Paraphoma chrysanthemicola TaxID=798071 RepID=A0A8K0VXA1_9PLEO|nr:hypothetical protein FB567DRAFT_530205 [Paraphoma chrysanthemicola]